jgi:hypothetical protein
MPEPTSTPPRRPSPEGREQPRSPVFRPNIQTRRYNFIRGRSPSRSPPRLQQNQDNELHLVQREWRNRPTSSSESESNSPPPPRRIHGTRPITPPRALTPPELRAVGQNPLEQLHRELDEVQNQLNRVVQRINEHHRPAAAQQRQPRSRSSSPRPVEADQNPKPMKFFTLLQREVKCEFVTPTDFIWTAIYERTLTRIISNLIALNPRKQPIWIYNRAYQRMQTFINANETCQLSYHRFVEGNAHDQRSLVTLMQTTDL